MVPFTAVGTAGGGSVSPGAKSADAVPRLVVLAAYPAELLLPTTLALVVPKRLAPEAADWFGDERPAGEPPPAAEIQACRNMSPQRDQDLAGGKAAAMARVVGAPLRSSNGGVLQYRVQGEGGGVSFQDTFPGRLEDLQDDAARPSHRYLLQGGC